MKKVLSTAVAVIVLGVAGSAMANSNIGCGIGTMVWGDKDAVVFQVLGATTNGFMGNQTFGITSGTLGCEKPSSVASTQRLEQFVAANMDAIARDIAAGSGETLATLAEMLQVADRAAFNASLKANFAKIFPSADVQPGQVIDAIASVI
jgi:hypothetical protein